MIANDLLQKLYDLKKEAKFKISLRDYHLYNLRSAIMVHLLSKINCTRYFYNLGQRGHLKFTKLADIQPLISIPARP